MTWLPALHRVLLVMQAKRAVICHSIMKLNSLGTRITLLVLAFCAAIALIFAAAMFFAQMSYYDELRQRQGNAFAANVVKMYPNLSKLST
ncbi:MAG: hypothetical protein RL341_2189, partial [Pseudomonadota bacterium]